MSDGGHHKGGKKLPDAFRYSPPKMAKYKEEEEHLKGHHTTFNDENHHGTDRNHHGTDLNAHRNDKNHHPIDRNHNGTDQNHHGTDRNHHGTDRNHHGVDQNHYGNHHTSDRNHEIDKNHRNHHGTDLNHHGTDRNHHGTDQNHHGMDRNHHTSDRNHHGMDQNHHPEPPRKSPPDHHPPSVHRTPPPEFPAAKKTPPHLPQTPHHTEKPLHPVEVPPHHKTARDHHPPPKAFDDYELERRRQLMDRQGWPARDTKDYLIGGIYGPQPKSKLANEAARNAVNNNNNHQDHQHPPPAAGKQPPPYQFPSHAANRAQQRKQKAAAKEPYRSRSYPREDNKRSNNGVPPRRIEPGARSLMDLKGPIPIAARNLSRNMDGDEFYLLDEDDEDYVTEHPPPNGPKHQRKGGGGGGGRISRAFDGPVATSELITTEGNNHRAKVVQFFKNGDPFFPGVKVSLRSGRDFASFEALCNHLTPRTDLPIGVRYIFNLDGEKIRDLDELEDGKMYVCSSRKKFVPLPYGTGQLGWKPHSKFKMEEDHKLFKPLSPTNGPAGNSSDGQPGSRGKKFIRVINNDNQSLQLRHMMNSRTTQPWENMIQGMADTLRMPNGKKLFSHAGKHIQSYSQLRNELRESDIFYMCSGDSFGPTLPRKSETSRSFDEASIGGHVRPVKGHRKSNRPVENDVREAATNRMAAGSRNRNNSKSPTLGPVEPIRMKIKGQRREVYPPLNHRFPRDESPPEKSLQLNWVYGYRGHDTQLNLSLLPTGELLYFVAAVAVLYDRSKNRQRHYTGHTEDIQCMTVHPTRELIATGQKEGKGRHSRAQVHIWDVETLSTQMIIGLNDVENGVVALSFSVKNLGQHLMIVDDSSDHMISIWNWKSKRLLSKSPIHRQKVVGGRFIPKDDSLCVTYGESHLTVWRKLKDGGFDRDDLLDDEAKHVTCVEFDDEEEQFLLTGDTDGNITLWSDGRTGLYQTIRVIQAHMRVVSAMMMLPDGTLLSSGGHEKDRYIKAWDSNHSFRAITFARLPESAGGVQSLCPSKLDSSDLGIFAGTSKNMILEGSIHRRFKIVVQGHSRQLSALAIDPDEPAFVTAGFDRAISRWAMHKLVWKVQVQSECTSLSIHPLGEVVCVGTVDGHIIVLTLHRGMHVATLPATKQVVTCLSYSPDGSNLAVALEEGGLILYGVSGRGYAYRRMKMLRGYDQILHMDWAIDAKAIQSVSSDYNLIFWDIVAMEQEKIPATMRDTKWHTLTCSLNFAVNGIWNNVNQMSDTVNTTCCASTSEKLLTVGDDEGYIRLFRYPCITPRADFHEYKAQSSKVNCIRFLYDDSFVISIGGDDAVLMQWMVIHSK